MLNRAPRETGAHVRVRDCVLSLTRHDATTSFLQEATSQAQAMSPVVQALRDHAEQQDLLRAQQDQRVAKILGCPITGRESFPSAPVPFLMVDNMVFVEAVFSTKHPTISGTLSVPRLQVVSALPADRRASAEASLHHHPVRSLADVAHAIMEFPDHVFAMEAIMALLANGTAVSSVRAGRDDLLGRTTTVQFRGRAAVSR